MLRYLIITLIGMALVTLQAGLVSLLPGRDPILILPLVVAVILVAEFQRQDALLIVVVAGLAMDAVSSLPPGVNVVLMVASWLAADFLFQRVFTNQSILAIFGLQASVYLFWVAGSSVIKAIRATILGWPWGESGVWPIWWLAVFGIFLQSGTAFIVIFGRKLLYQRFAQGLMITGRKERGWSR